MFDMGVFTIAQRFSIVVEFNLKWKSNLGRRKRMHFFKLCSSGLSEGLGNSAFSLCLQVSVSDLTPTLTISTVLSVPGSRCLWKYKQNGQSLAVIRPYCLWVCESPKSWTFQLLTTPVHVHDWQLPLLYTVRSCNSYKILQDGDSNSQFLGKWGPAWKADSVSWVH